MKNQSLSVFTDFCGQKIESFPAGKENLRGPGYAKPFYVDISNNFDLSSVFSNSEKFTSGQEKDEKLSKISVAQNTFQR